MKYLGYIPHSADTLVPFLAAAVYPAVVCLVFVAVAFRYRRPALFYRNILNHLRPRTFMSQSEHELFHRLNIALAGRYAVCPQPAFSSFVTDDGKLFGSQLWKVRALFNTKRADFGLYDWQKKRIVALVELDDSSHIGKGAEDRQRDAIATAAGIKTYRLRAGDDTTPLALAEILSGLYTAK